MALSNQLLVAVAMVVALLVTSVAGASTCYPFYWNVGDSFLHEDVSMYGIMPGSDTQTGNGCSTPGCKSWTQGVWPTINSKGEKVNGGVPQAANLTLHLETIRQTLPNWIPGKCTVGILSHTRCNAFMPCVFADPNWDGNAVFDFEAWTPIWAQNIGSGSWHSNVYQKASIELVKAAHPTWNDVKVYAEAGKEFQAAALNFMVETLKLVKSMRPNVKTGFYGYACLQGRKWPYCAYALLLDRLPANPFQPCWGENGQHPKCGYDFPVLGDVWKKENDDVQALWDESTALFPSIYVPPFQTPLATQDYINATVAVRCWTHAVRRGMRSSHCAVAPAGICASRQRYQTHICIYVELLPQRHDAVGPRGPPQLLAAPTLRRSRRRCHLGRAVTPRLSVRVLFEE